MNWDVSAGENARNNQFIYANGQSHENNEFVRVRQVGLWTPIASNQQSAQGYSNFDDPSPDRSPYRTCDLDHFQLSGKRVNQDIAGDECLFPTMIRRLD
jgi:hypothetical protein